MRRRILLLFAMSIALTTVAQWHIIDMRHGLSESRIRKMCQMHDGRIAIATTATIDIYDGTRFTSFKLLPEFAYPLSEYLDKRQLTCDEEGRIWLRNARTLYVVDTRAGKLVENVGKLMDELGIDNKTVAEWKQVHCPTKVMGISKVSAMLRDCYGGLWIGTEENGIYYSNIQREHQFTTSKDSFAYSPKPPIRSNRTSALASRYASMATNCSLETADGYAWLGTRNGLMVFDADDRHIVTIDSRQGFSTDNVQSLICDNKGDIWAATANGISRCHFNKGRDSLDITNFGEFDGLKLEGREFRACNIYCDSTGRIIVGFAGGSVSFMPDSVCAPCYIFHCPIAKTPDLPLGRIIIMVVAIMVCLTVVFITFIFRSRKYKIFYDKRDETPIMASDSTADILQASEETSADVEFLAKLKATVKSNISDEDFSVQTLSEMMAMERTGLYRRMLSLTGKSPSEYIKDIRMEVATRLLRCSDLPIHTIAQRTGFSTTKYFSRVFKQSFNISPQEYRDNHPN